MDSCMGTVVQRPGRAACYVYVRWTGVPRVVYGGAMTDGYYLPCTDWYYPAMHGLVLPGLDTPGLDTPGLGYTWPWNSWP